MGLFDRIEAKLASTINGAFARAFKAEVQPVEISSAMRKAMDDKAAIVSAGRAIVPNYFMVELSPSDHERLTAFTELLTEELVASAEEHIANQHYRPAGPIRIEFVEDEDLETGVFRVRSSGSRSPVSRAPGRREPRRPGEVIETHYSSEDPRSRVPSNQVFPPEAVNRADGSAGVAGQAAHAAASAARGTADAGQLWSPARNDAPDMSPAEREAQRRNDLAAWGDDDADSASEQGRSADHDSNQDLPNPQGHSSRSDARSADVADHSYAPEYPEYEPYERPSRTPAVPPEMRPDPANRPWLEVNGDAYPLLAPITVIGRDPHAEITLDDGGISRRHLEIRVTHDGPHLVIGLRDLGSTNGTYVNGERVTSARLSDGDRITIGRISFVVHTRRR